MPHEVSKIEDIELDPLRQNVVFTDIEDDEEDKLPIGFKPVELDNEQHDQILDLITNNIEEIIRSRQDEGLEEDWQANQDQYDGILPTKEYPSERSANFNFPITADVVDTLFAQTERGIFFNTPIVGVEPAPFEAHEEEPGIDVEISEKKEEFLDFKFTDDVPIKSGSEFARFQACLHGNGFMRLSWLYKTEPQYDEEKYEGLKDIEKFKKNYPDWVDEPEMVKRMRKLEKDKTVNVEVEYDVVVHNDPIPESVDINDFIIHPLVKDLQSAGFIAERQSMTGDEILREVKNKFFRKDCIDKIKENNAEFQSDTEDEKTSNKFHNTDFEIFRVCFKHSFDPKQPQKRYLAFVLYDREKSTRKCLLQIFYYPWWHNRWDYIDVYISPKRRKGIYRDGLAIMLRDPQALANVSLDIMVDSGISQVIPSFKGRKGNKKQISGELSKGHYAGVIYWLDNPETDLINLEVGGRNIQFMEHILAGAERMSQLRSGIGSGLSGRNLPQDPNAPAAKESLLLGQASIRIGPFLDRMQESLFRETAYQTIQLYYQFQPSGVRYRVLGGAGQMAFPTLTRDELRKREHYTPMGSAEYLDQGDKLQKDQLVVKLSLEHPDLRGFAPARRFMLKEIIKDLGTPYRRKLNKIVPTEEQMNRMELERTREALRQEMAAREQEQGMQQQEGKIRMRTQQLLGEGLTPDQAKATVMQEFGIKGNGAV